MPWELTIRRADNAPMGPIDVVRKKMIDSLPGLQFYMEPSGAEKLAASEARGIVMPDVIREMWQRQPALEQADYEGDAFHIRLFGFGEVPLFSVDAEIRGNGNPLPVIAALCRPNGWIAIDLANRQPVDLEAEAASGWKSFTNWRDDTIKKHQEEEAKKGT
jgi:hypothetical protein